MNRGSTVWMRDEQHKEGTPEQQQQQQAAEETSDEDEEDGWEDQEGDYEAEVFVCLFDSTEFGDLRSMLDHCKTIHSFDIWTLQRRYDLDFIGLVKLVNYVREQVSQGFRTCDLSSRGIFDQDKYLRPTLLDDAVLHSLEEIAQDGRDASTNTIEELTDNLKSLQASFDAYRGDMRQYLGYDFDRTVERLPNGRPVESPPALDNTEDAEYFHSYSYNSIHETMLKDKIRTDAYRDFIYNNKDIFSGKVVLDVGCGTGILSMFCAKAGAERVIAVDNSEIVDTARKIIKANGLESQIQCIRGKIEEIKLPVDKVDIIVSEWMGYCLLYESMLDSVIFARDRYLKPAGLMVPSHATICLTSIVDSELRAMHIDFWNDVYGFDMQEMRKRAYQEAVIKVLDPDELGCRGVTMKVLDLHLVAVRDLDIDAQFSLQIKAREEEEERSGLFEGFALWFDIFFTRARGGAVDVTALDEAGLAAAQTTVLTTSPYSHPTHWQQCACLIDSPEHRINTATAIEGSIRLRKRQKFKRALEIDIGWQIEDSEQQAQTWFVE